MKVYGAIPLCLVALCLIAAVALGGQKPSRARSYGLYFGDIPTGPLNAITDVVGVKVGHVTVNEGQSQRTGVTAILPHPGNLFLEKVPGAIHAANGFGKLAGYTQVKELGQIETPILLTNTLSVGAVTEGVIRYMMALPGNENLRSVNAVVGETNDGKLNDIRALFPRPEHAMQAIADAKGDALQEGNIGAGTGTICHGFKGGIGTSSRVLPKKFGGYTLGVLVQTNFGRTLHLEGVPVYLKLNPKFASADPGGEALGSCMIVVATDAPLDSLRLNRLAKRAMLGLAKTGGVSSTSSGDYVIAFSTDPTLRMVPGKKTDGGRVLSHEKMTPLFQAVIDATEEAIINSLFAAETTTGKDGLVVHALPKEKAMEILRKEKKEHRP